MGIWAGIKHSLNSTLGTNEFQPLDKLLRYGSKQFTASNDIYKAVFSGTTTSKIPAGTVTGSIIDLCSIRPKIGGSFTVTASTGVIVAGTTAIYSSLLVYINDVYYGKATFTKKSSDTATSGNISINVPFKAGDKISFKWQGTLSMSVDSGTCEAQCWGLNILGQVVDNLIEMV